MLQIFKVAYNKGRSNKPRTFNLTQTTQHESQEGQIFAREKEKCILTTSQSSMTER